MGTVNISIPEEIVAKMDSLIKEMGYASRSELVRNALRSFFNEAEWTKLTGRILAVVTIVLDAERRGGSEEVNRLQHRYGDLILTTIHNHLGSNCLEVVLTAGDVNRTKKFVEELKVVRGIETVKVAVALANP